MPQLESRLHPLRLFKSALVIAHNLHTAWYFKSCLHCSQHNVSGVFAAVRLYFLGHDGKEHHLDMLATDETSF